MDSIKLDALRHSAAHLLAAAVMDLWPKTKRAIGPSISNGFYYDFEFVQPLSEDDLGRIESKMHELVKTWNKFEESEVTEVEARKRVKGNPYKEELIDEIIQKGEKITFYQSGAFSDLCRGGHCDNPKSELQHFKLLSIAGAYWRGSEKNKMLTRIYGTAFFTKQELDEYLIAQEEAKKRDHRKLGEQLDLFIINEKVGKGLILWLPKGDIIKEEIEKWAKQTEEDWGYQRVTTPHITKSELYYTSGHLPYYKGDMYPPMRFDDGEEYFLKPMNCPHHHMIYASRQKSYRDLPLRLAEFGTCYRYEASGELFGMMRVRGFTQNDSHIYCTVEQAVEEFVTVMKLHEYYYKSLGINKYHLELALRDPKNTKKYHGNKEMWILAEELMRKAVAKTNIPMVEQEGSAAFYGPKIDFIVHSSIGREFAVSTNQIDPFMGERFGLKYTDQSGLEKTPVIIHRAPLGSHERFIGFLIEHYGGAFPLWLAPVQVAILPVSNVFDEEALIAGAILKNAGVRTVVDTNNKTLGGKIREWTLQKVPYLAIIGGKEKEKSTNEKKYVSVRTGEGTDLGMIDLAQWTRNLQKQISEKTQ